LTIVRLGESEEESRQRLGAFLERLAPIAAMYRAKAAGGRQFAWGRPVGQSGSKISGALRLRGRDSA